LVKVTIGGCGGWFYSTNRLIIKNIKYKI
jgi:hypothetical protein